jgi:CheY-like chemotaxis protein
MRLVSLQGDLEDLPLLDILQIVAFAEKTGYLTIEAPPGDAGLVFRKGRIVASFIWDNPPLDARAASQPEEQRSALIRQRVETSLEQLTRLREGPFRFELTTQPPSSIGDHDLSNQTLAVGINPQELLLGLAQGIDEDRRDSVAAVESAFVEASPVAIEGVSAPATEPDEARASPEEVEPRPPDGSESAGPRRRHVVLLVEDEADVRESLAATLVQGGCEVVEATDPLSALGQARRLAERGRSFVLVVDRGMPSSDGASFDGGLELLRRLRQAELRPPVLLMTDRMTRPLEERARRLGVARTVFKPGLSRLDPAQFEADLRAFAARIVDDVLPGLAKGSRAGRALAAPPRKPSQGDGMSTLVRRLQELSGPRDAFQVSTLVMKVAREFFERAVLFVVKDDALRGLTAFGPAARDEIVLLVRELVIPLDAPTVLGRAAAARRSFVGQLPEDEWDRLDQTLGRFRSSQVAVLPLTTHRDTIALLFGDNPETGAELGSLDGLELFLNQAGLALENVFLQRKLRARETSGVLGEGDLAMGELRSRSVQPAATRMGGLQ